MDVKQAPSQKGSKEGDFKWPRTPREAASPKRIGAEDPPATTMQASTRFFSYDTVAFHEVRADYT
jgi:hypothetical protein